MKEGKLDEWREGERVQAKAKSDKIQVQWVTVTETTPWDIAERYRPT